MSLAIGSVHVRVRRGSCNLRDGLFLNCYWQNNIDQLAARSLPNGTLIYFGSLYIPLAGLTYTSLNRLINLRQLWLICDYFYVRHYILHL